MGYFNGVVDWVGDPAPIVVQRGNGGYYDKESTDAEFVKANRIIAEQRVEIKKLDAIADALGFVVRHCIDAGMITREEANNIFLAKRKEFCLERGVPEPENQ